MAPQAISVAFQTDKALAAYGPLAERVESYGFDGVTVYNDMLYQPAWLPLLEMARATRRVRLGPAAVNPYTCHPVNIAGNIALIDEASHGRAYLGLARGSWLEFVGLRPERPVQGILEALSCIRNLLRGSKEPFHGQVFSLAGGDSLRWGIPRPEIPFLLGSWGVRTIQACLSAVTEIKIGGTANPDVVPFFRRHMEAAGSRSGRVGLVVGAVTVVDWDGQAARQRARREVALYLPVVAALDPALQVDPDLLEGMQKAADRYAFDEVAALISDDLLGCFAFAGTPHEVADQALTLLQAGADRVEFGTPHGLDPGEGLRLLGTEVLPAIRSGL